MWQYIELPEASGINPADYDVPLPDGAMENMRELLQMDMVKSAEKRFGRRIIYDD